MIFIYCTVAAFALVIAVDEISQIARTRSRRRASRRATSADWEDSARPDTNVFGAEFDPDFEWPERPSNVYPIHARRSLAQPHLRAVPSQPTDAA